MAQTLVEIIVHVVFSTKNRENLIPTEIESELFAYIGGILRKHESTLMAANGTENHVHLLILQSKKIALSDLVREIKRASSLWIKQKDAKFNKFKWQGGYGAFSVSKLQIDVVKNYIAKQKEHHKKENFDDEYRKFLKRYEMDFDERYFLD
ncbi:MAG: IS200/IS605 family transposase [Acidobacteriota bacterium]|jgi:REP element-mobilizing transposase RayT|nr:IS200/IS605 family transposase [Acidobacteriota bacterium]